MRVSGSRVRIPPVNSSLGCQNLPKGEFFTGNTSKDIVHLASTALALICRIPNISYVGSNIFFRKDRFCLKPCMNSLCWSLLCTMNGLHGVKREFARCATAQQLLQRGLSHLNIVILGDGVSKFNIRSVDRQVHSYTHRLCDASTADLIQEHNWAPAALVHSSSAANVCGDNAVQKRCTQAAGVATEVHEMCERCMPCSENRFGLSVSSTFISSDKSRL